LNIERIKKEIEIGEKIVEKIDDKNEIIFL